MVRTPCPVCKITTQRSKKIVALGCCATLARSRYFFLFSLWEYEYACFLVCVYKVRLSHSRGVTWYISIGECLKSTNLVWSLAGAIHTGLSIEEDSGWKYQLVYKFDGCVPNGSVEFDFCSGHICRRSCLARTLLVESSNYHGYSGWCKCGVLNEHYSLPLIWKEIEFEAERVMTESANEHLFSHPMQWTSRPTNIFSWQ